MAHEPPSNGETPGFGESIRKLSTTLERADDRVRFVAKTRDPLYQDRLEHLGYPGVGGARFATAWFPSSPGVSAYYERFASSIEQMVLQSARLVPVPWEDALLEFLRRVEGSSLRWWLYGTAALAVRGLDVEPGDVDVNVDDAALAGRIFDDVLVTPVQELQGWAARYVGRAFDGAIVEWLSEPYAENDDPARPYEQGPFVADRLETVEWRGQLVHVPPLAAQLRTCERRRLDDRARLIRAAMRVLA
jgi:hypothetical protein